MKQISLDGRIGKDAETLTTKGGKKYIRFSVANDTFINGENKTEWFDVTCYDPFIVENRVKYLSKGRYVIIHGSINTEVNTKNGKLYLNQYVTANSIDTPSFGTKKEDEKTEETVSTFSTGSFVKTEETKQTATVQPSPSFAYSASLSNSDGDDDLPF